MLPKEYLESWNELCAECKMVETDLANPTEDWLTKVLISYLRMFGYRVEIPNYEDGTSERRLYLIKIVRHIDHLYKITDRTFTFTYYDLLKPTPKKTSHMLRILLNYLYYFNMFKTNVFKMATDRLKERQELMDEIKYTMEENKKRSFKSEKMQEELVSVSKQIPLHRNEIKLLDSQIKQRKGQAQQMQDAIKDLKSKIDELKAQIRNLKRQIVPEDEGQELQTHLVKLQENIFERGQQTQNADSNLKMHIEDNKRLQEIMKLVETAKEILSSHFIESFNETVKKIDSTKANVASYEKEKEQLIQRVSRHQKNVQSLQEITKLEQAQHDEEKLKKRQTILCKQKERDIIETEAASLKQEILAVENSLNDQKDICSYIQKNFAKLMESYK